MKRLLFFLLMNATLSHAQQVIGEPLSEILKDMKPAGAACMKDDPTPETTSPKAAAPVPDFACAIGVHEAARVLEQAGSVLIDLRAPLEFQSHPIPGALNASLADLSAKPYWRNKTVLLISDGRAYPELYRDCAALKKQGYRDLRIVQGGLPAWVAAGKPMAGRVPSAARLARIPPTELASLAGMASQRVFFEPGQAELQKEIKGVVLADDRIPTLRQAIEADRMKRKPEPLLGVILVVAPNISEERIDTLQKAIAPLPLRVYAETPRAYLNAVNQQAAMAKARAAAPRRSRCGL